MVRLLLGLVIGILLVPVAAYLWLSFGKVPVAVTDPELPHEREITSIPLDARIQHEMIVTPPMQVDENTLVAGAHIYTDRCSVCHGLHGKSSAFGSEMFPEAPQLLEKHHNSSVVGVSDDPPGETYWKIYNGIRLSGMPSFRTQLTETQMWQVTLLLANADRPVPPAALDILNHASPPPAETIK